MEYGQVLYFTPRDEECTELLSGIGLKRNMARVLVYLAQSTEATSREIERGTDLRQPEVSIVMRDLKERGWVESRESKTESKGRPVKIYTLSLDLNGILTQLENEKQREMQDHIRKIGRLRTILSTDELSAP